MRQLQLTVMDGSAGAPADRCKCGAWKVHVQATSDLTSSTGIAPTKVVCFGSKACMLFTGVMGLVKKLEAGVR